MTVLRLAPVPRPVPLAILAPPMGTLGGRRRQEFRATAVLALLAIAACRRGPSPRDLVEEFPSAELYAEPGLIDLGVEAGRPYLREGWSYDEADPDGATNFVRSLGPRSVLEFTLPQPRDLRIRLRGAPFAATGTPPQRVSASLNGSTPRSIELPRGFSEHEIGFAASETREGPNRLELTYAWTRRPRDTGQGRDRRPLAVSWDFVHVVGLTRAAEAGPRVLDRKHALFVPWGSSVRYHLKVPPGSLFSLQGLSQTGEGRLEVRLERDDAPAATVMTRDGRSSGQESARLPFGGVVRVSLTASSPRLGQPGGVIVLAPAVSAERDVATPTPAPLAPAREHPPIVIYLVDTLRADRLGCYGQARPLTPRIDAFARDAVLFENAVSESSWTRPAIASLFTGLPARRHGVNDRSDALPPDAVTLAELLAGLGYETVGFTLNGNVAPTLGFSQGFSRYELLPGGKESAQTPAEPVERKGAPRSLAVLEQTRPWLAGRSEARPLFLFAHVVDPHLPYAPSPQWRTRFAPDVRDPTIGSRGYVGHLAGVALKGGGPAVDEGLVRDLRSLYDAAVAEADEAFGLFLDELRRRGLYDEAVILFLSDHGEEFYEHGDWLHGRTLHYEVLHVPFILKLPSGRGASGRRVQGLVQLEDVLPTLLDLVGEKPPPTMAGMSVLGRLSGSAAAWAGTAGSYLDLDGIRAESVQAEGFKLIRRHTPRGPASALYDVARDLGERSDVLPERPLLGGYLRTLLAARLRAERPAWDRTQAVMDEAVEQNLRALGYVR